MIEIPLQPQIMITFKKKGAERFQWEVKILGERISRKSAVILTFLWGKKCRPGTANKGGTRYRQTLQRNSLSFSFRVWLTKVFQRLRKQDTQGQTDCQTDCCQLISYPLGEKKKVQTGFTFPKLIICLLPLSSSINKCCSSDHWGAWYISKFFKICISTT